MYLEHNILSTIVRYFSENFSEEDDTLLTEWLKNEDNKQFFDKVTADGYMAEQLERLIYFKDRMEANRALVLNKIKSQEVAVPMKVISRSRIIKLAAAAACILLFCVVYFRGLQNDKTPQTASTNEVQVDSPAIQSGTYNATLQLANGKIIALDTIPHGRLANEDNAIITIDGKQISYEAATGTPRIESTYNTLTTGAGQTYALVLPDGTRVWLNALASIRFPVAFSGKERHVIITGEVYLEVAHDPEHPFTVSIHGELPKGIDPNIKVLGTRFNVNAYGDEGTIRTTLLEGKIMLQLGNNRQTIKPGQQAVTSDKIKITNNIDTAQIVAWKNGKFNFEKSDLPTVMNQIARWYNVQIEYPAKIPEKSFWGTLRRDMKLNVLLATLDSISGLHFQIEGRKVIIK